MAIDHTEERKLFEEKAYSIYFNGVMSGEQGQWQLAVPTALLNQLQFCELDADGRYTNTKLETGWAFWKHRAELDASGDLFAVIQDTHASLAAQIAENQDQLERVPAPMRTLTKTLEAFILSIQSLPT